MRSNFLNFVNINVWKFGICVTQARIFFVKRSLLKFFCVNQFPFVNSALPSTSKWFIEFSPKTERYDLWDLKVLGRNCLHKAKLKFDEWTFEQGKKFIFEPRSWPGLKIQPENRPENRNFKFLTLTLSGFDIFNVVT